MYGDCARVSPCLYALSSRIHNIGPESGTPSRERRSREHVPLLFDRDCIVPVFAIAKLGRWGPKRARACSLNTSDDTGIARRRVRVLTPSTAGCRRRLYLPSLQDSPKHPSNHPVPFVRGPGKLIYAFGLGGCCLIDLRDLSLESELCYLRHTEGRLDALVFNMLRLQRVAVCEETLHSSFCFLLDAGLAVNRQEHQFFVTYLHFSIQHSVPVDSFGKTDVV